MKPSFWEPALCMSSAPQRARGPMEPVILLIPSHLGQLYLCSFLFYHTVTPQFCLPFFFFFLVPSQSLSQSTEIRAEITDVLTGITDALLLQQKHFQVDSEPAARCHAIWVVPRMAPVIRTSEVTESTQNFPSGHLSQTQCTSSARRPALRVSRNIPGRLVHLLQRLPNTFRSHNNNNKILF